MTNDRKALVPLFLAIAYIVFCAFFLTGFLEHNEQIPLEKETRAGIIAFIGVLLYCLRRDIGLSVTYIGTAICWFFTTVFTGNGRHFPIALDINQNTNVSRMIQWKKVKDSNIKLLCNIGAITVIILQILFFWLL